MPIKTVQHGTRWFKTITFGTGDVAVMGACTTENENTIKLIFSQDVEKPIDKWDESPIPDGTTSEDLPEETVFLEFNKLKSVDVVIEKLMEVREGLIKSGVTE